MLFVVDANELFSALISRGKTLELFFHPEMECVAPDFMTAEFNKHKKEIVQKSGLEEEDINNFFFLLKEKIRFFRTSEFDEFLQKAEKICPDKDDVDYFTLSLKLNCPVWSEDKKLKEQNEIEVYSTEDLIKKFNLK